MDMYGIEVLNENVLNHEKSLSLVSKIWMGVLKPWDDGTEGLWRFLELCSCSPAQWELNIDLIEIHRIPTNPIDSLCFLMKVVFFASQTCLRSTLDLHFLLWIVITCSWFQHVQGDMKRMYMVYVYIPIQLDIKGSFKRMSEILFPRPNELDAKGFSVLGFEGWMFRPSG